MNYFARQGINGNIFNAHTGGLTKTNYKFTALCTAVPTDISR